MDHNCNKYLTYIPDHPGTNTILIMCSSERTCILVREFLSTMDGQAPPGKKGRTLMEGYLRSYLFWKGKLGKQGKDSDGKSKSDGTSGAPPGRTAETAQDSGVSEALRRKDARNKERQGSRRRVRGGAPGSTDRASGGGVERANDPSARSGAMGGEGVLKEEADELALL